MFLSKTKNGLAKFAHLSVNINVFEIQSVMLEVCNEDKWRVVKEKNMIHVFNIT